MADFGFEPLPWETLDNRGMAEKAKAIYEKIKDGLEAEHKGEVVAIDIESGDYFLGKTGLEAARRARARYPNRIPYIIRIGRPAYISFRRLGCRSWVRAHEWLGAGTLGLKEATLWRQPKGGGVWDDGFRDIGDFALAAL